MDNLGCKELLVFEQIYINIFFPHLPFLHLFHIFEFIHLCAIS